MDDQQAVALERARPDWSSSIATRRSKALLEVDEVLRRSIQGVSDLLRGRIDLFSTDALIDMLARLGVGVRLVVKPVKSRRVA